MTVCDRLSVWARFKRNAAVCMHNVYKWAHCLVCLIAYAPSQPASQPAVSTLASVWRTCVVGWSSGTNAFESEAYVQYVHTRAHTLKLHTVYFVYFFFFLFFIQNVSNSFKSQGYQLPKQNRSLVAIAALSDDSSVWLYWNDTPWLRKQQQTAVYKTKSARWNEHLQTHRHTHHVCVYGYISVTNSRANARTRARFRARLVKPTIFTFDLNICVEWSVQTQCVRFALFSVDMVTNTMLACHSVQHNCIIVIVMLCTHNYSAIPNGHTPDLLSKAKREREREKK